MSQISNELDDRIAILAERIEALIDTKKEKVCDRSGFVSMFKLITLTSLCVGCTLVFYGGKKEKSSECVFLGCSVIAANAVFLYHARHVAFRSSGSKDDKCYMRLLLDKVCG
jgi:hypothetical protein